MNFGQSFDMPICLPMRLTTFLSSVTYYKVLFAFAFQKFRNLFQKLLLCKKRSDKKLQLLISGVCATIVISPFLSDFYLIIERLLES
jgi:hypothetical protein